MIRKFEVWIDDESHEYMGIEVDVEDIWGLLEDYYKVDRAWEIDG